MLTITIPDREFYDEEKEVFVNIKGQTLKLEHSLVSLSKWEAKWKKPLLRDSLNNITSEEILDYIRCMTITQNVDPEIYTALPKDIVDQITEYINDPMTATVISTHGRSKQASKRNTETVTSELIYYWMIIKGIPMECQRWHLNRLLTLINVHNVKESADNKMSKRDIFRHNREINNARRAKYGTKG